MAVPASTQYSSALSVADARAISAVRVWLFIVAGLVAAMVALGGATRLTESGLSITEWQPIMGAIPPLTAADWHEAFEKYRQIPEYKLINRGMSLAEFQFIFWWEWAHRFLGRLIGVVFGAGLVWFWIKGRIKPWLKPRLLALFVLGGIQGAIGWYMVQSGLVDRTDVSQYRLALHLSVALIIFCWLFWLALRVDLDDDQRRMVAAPVWGSALAVATVLSVQIVMGAFVAGLKAGKTYNTWPLMDGKLIPSGLVTLDPWYLNLFENITTVQFAHRVMAYVLIVAVIVHVVRMLRHEAVTMAQARSAAVLAGTVVLQAVLGVVTLLSVVAIPLGVAHQAGAVAVLAALVWHVHQLTQPGRVSRT